MRYSSNKLFETSDIPSFDPKADMSKLKLSPKDAFVLSRVDGKLSLEKISSVAGVSLEEVVEIFERLIKEGAIKFSKVEPKINKGMHGGKFSILEQLEEDEKYESLAKIPRQLRREILMFEEDLDKKNHYDLLGVPRNVTNDKLKKTYFKMSKEFHPDRFFGKEIGIYKKKLEKIFQKLTDAFNTLSDKKKKHSYDQETFSEVKRKVDEVNKAEEDFKRPKTLIERLAKGKKFFNMGELEFKKRNTIAAANYYKLAMSYDPCNEEYKKAFLRTKPDLDKKKAKVKFEEAKEKTDFGDYEKAITLMTDAVELCPENGEYNFLLARLLLSHNKDCVKSKEHCLKAIETMGNNADVRVTLGQIYKMAGLTKNAEREFKLALKLDKENQTAKMELEDIK